MCVCGYIIFIIGAFVCYVNAPPNYKTMLNNRRPTRTMKTTQPLIMYQSTGGTISPQHLTHPSLRVSNLVISSSSPLPPPAACTEPGYIIRCYIILMMRLAMGSLDKLTSMRVCVGVYVRAYSYTHHYILLLMYLYILIFELICINY